MILRKMLFLRLPKLPPGGRLAVESAVYGLVAGLMAVAFQAGINQFYHVTLGRFALWSTGPFLLASFLTIVGTSLLSGLLLNRVEPEAAGSGIPQLKLAFWKDFGFVRIRLIVVKFLAGVLAVGGGSSLGREGPTVQLAGGAASIADGFLGKAKTGRRRAAASGAAAGLAAAFDTPLAAIAFVLEEILGDLNSGLLGSVVVASVLGAFVVHALIGRLPAFAIPDIKSPTWRGNLLVPIVAVLASLAGVLFQSSALGLRKAFRIDTMLRRIPPWCRPACGAFGTWVIGSAVFLSCGHLGVFSLGYDDLAQGLSGQLAIWVVLLLLVGKLVATVLSYGSGGCGGIFAPTLFFGVMVGCCLSGAAREIGFPLSSDDALLLAVVGMSACLGAVVRAPFTSILIVFEMTRQFSLVPGLLIGGLVSQTVSRLLVDHNFYDQVLADDGHVLAMVIPPRDFREWQERPVSMIANFRPFVAADLSPGPLLRMLESTVYPRVIYAPPSGVPQLIMRDEALASLAASQSIPLHSVPTCPREATIRAAQDKLVASDHGFLVILDREAGTVIGVLTLHDLLRSQQNLAL